MTDSSARPGSEGLMTIQQRNNGSQSLPSCFRVPALSHGGGLRRIIASGSRHMLPEQAELAVSEQAQCEAAQVRCCGRLIRHGRSRPDVDTAAPVDLAPFLQPSLNASYDVRPAAPSSFPLPSLPLQERDWLRPGRCRSWLCCIARLPSHRTIICS